MSLEFFSSTATARAGEDPLGELCSMAVIDLPCPVLALYLQIESLDPVLPFAQRL